MKVKNYLIDIGELGWSLYLSAYFKHLKKEGINPLCIITTKDRFALYPGADSYSTVPLCFDKKYGLKPAECFGKAGVSNDEMTTFFARYIDFGSKILNPFNNRLPPEMMFGAYKVRKKILVFPRRRAEAGYSQRNLSLTFYEKLVETLCQVFGNEYDIVSVGKMGGAYSIRNERLCFIDKVSPKTTIQDVLDICALSVAAIGGTSSLPKLSALQGVPTFVIGHEKERFIERENWAKTPVEFYEIGHDKYNGLEFTAEIMGAIVKFIERIKGNV
jgi:hypothetical protein